MLLLLPRVLRIRGRVNLIDWWRRILRVVGHLLG